MRAVERALVIALVCARHQGRYEWAGILRTGPVLAAATWDCLPQPATDIAALTFRPPHRAASESERPCRGI